MGADGICSIAGGMTRSRERRQALEEAPPWPRSIKHRGELSRGGSL
jgi:hypothetical protein